jgi:hypothetical protein
MFKLVEKEFLNPFLPNCISNLIKNSTNMNKEDFTDTLNKFVGGLKLISEDELLFKTLCEEDLLLFITLFKDLGKLEVEVCFFRKIFMFDLLNHIYYSFFFFFLDV